MILAIGLLPTILREQTRDWIAYEQAADRLASGEPLYVFELGDARRRVLPLPAANGRDLGGGRQPEALLAIKVLALIGVASLVVVVAPRASTARR